MTRHLAIPSGARWCAAAVLLVTLMVQAAPLRSVYDAEGRLRFWMDANGAAASPQRIGYQRHDRFGRVVEEGLVEGQFDAALLGRLAEIPGEPSGSARQWRRRFFYAADAGTAKAPVPGALLAVHTRDEQGAVHVQAFRHDALGRVAMVTESVAPGEPALQTRYHRDALGRVVRIDGPAPVGESQPDGLLLRNDAQGRVLAIGRHRHGVEEPDHYARYTWDAAGRLTTEVRNPHSRNGRLLLRYKRDVQGRLVSVRAWVGGRLAYAQKLQYGDGILIRAMRQDYLLEPGGPRSLHWQRVELPVPGDVDTVVLDARRERVLQLQQAGESAPHAYAHDRNGNVLRKTGRLERLAIDPFLDLPVAVDTSDGQKMRMRYGGLRTERVWQAGEVGPPQAREQVTQGYYRGLEDYPLMISHSVQAGEAAPVRRSRQRLVWGPGGLVAVGDEGAGAGGEERFVIGNHQGSTVMVLAADGRPMASYAYSAAGRISDPAGHALRQAPLVPYLFQGLEYDWATGLHNFRARLYDSDSLRFLAPDPVPGQPAYLAMNGDPVNWLDPDGRMMAQVNDFRTGFKRHALGLAASLIMTGTTLGMYGAYAAGAAASYPLVATLAITTSTVYGGYLLYGLFAYPAQDRNQVFSAVFATVSMDQIAVGTSGVTLVERLLNATYGLGLSVLQIGGGKVAVSFGTPIRGEAYDMNGRWNEYGPPRVYAWAYLTNTLAMQPINGAVVYFQSMAGRRPKANLTEVEQLGWMATHDVVGNACYYYCALFNTINGAYIGRERYRMKGCVHAWTACRAISRGSFSVAMKPKPYNTSFSNAFNDMVVGGLIDYTVGTQLMSKLELSTWYEGFLLDDDD